MGWHAAVRKDVETPFFSPRLFHRCVPLNLEMAWRADSDADEKTVLHPTMRSLPHSRLRFVSWVKRSKTIVAMTTQEALNVRVEHYMDLLRHLETNVKLALIAKLSASVVEAQASEEKKPSLDELAGSWQLDEGQTADDLVNDIRVSRTSNREIESF